MHVASDDNTDKAVKPVEFYDFLNVHPETTKSEVIDQARTEDEEVDQAAVNEQKPRNSTPFFDFLSLGKQIS